MINLVKKVFKKFMKHLVLKDKIFFLFFLQVSKKKEKGPDLVLKIRLNFIDIYNGKDLEFFHTK